MTASGLALACRVDKLGFVQVRYVAPKYDFDIRPSVEQGMVPVLRRHSKESDLVDESVHHWMYNTPEELYDLTDNMDEVRIHDVEEYYGIDEEGTDEDTLTASMLARLVEGRNCFGHLIDWRRKGEVEDGFEEQIFEAPPNWRKV